MNGTRLWIPSPPTENTRRFRPFVFLGALRVKILATSYQLSAWKRRATSSTFARLLKAEMRK